jgi:hypothetical protein
LDAFATARFFPVSTFRFECVGNGFLDEQRQAALDAGEADWHVELVRRGDHHAIQVRTLDQVAKVVVVVGAVLPGNLPTGVRRIGDARQSKVRIGRNQLRVAPTDQACADQAEPCRAIARRHVSAVRLASRSADSRARHRACALRIASPRCSRRRQFRR